MRCENFSTMESIPQPKFKLRDTINSLGSTSMVACLALDSTLWTKSLLELG